MKFKSKPAPHISYPQDTRSLMNNVILTLLVLYALSFFYYGLRALVLGAVGGLFGLLLDQLCRAMFRRHANLRDLSGLVTGLLIPLMMPASIPFYVPILAITFALLVAKHPFGGTGHNIFNPAAAGIAFAIIAFPQLMFQYPVPLSPLPIFPDETLVTVRSPLFTLGLRGLPDYDIVSMALGNAPGPMGATNSLVLLACLLFLLARRTLQWETPVFFLLTTMAFSFYFPSLGTTRMESMLYEMMNGLLLFGAVFLLGDPVTRPKRDWANILYAVITGIVVMVFRRIGRVEEEFVFALLLMNVMVWPIDMLVERLVKKRRRKHRETIRR